ncbi:MAG: response regulator [Ignavibacteria bacterium]
MYRNTDLSKNVKILLIEDNPGDARLIKEYLNDVKNSKFNLEICNKLHDGINVLANRDVDLILLDLNLPDSEGLVSFDKIFSITSKVPIIVLTGLNDEGTALNAVQRGAQDYIVKDTVESDSLKRAIRYAIERKKSEEEHQKFMEQRVRSSAIIEAQENERRRISRELHDGIGQLLSAAKLNFGMVDIVQNHDKEKTSDILKQIDSLITKAIVEARRISHDLRPTTLDDFGLIPSLRILCQEFSKSNDIKIKFQVSQLLERINSKAEIAIYRIIQEAFTNISKYAEATEVSLDLCRKDNTIIVKVKDNGKGFEQDEFSKNKKTVSGLGLINMRERAELVGGKFQIQSSPGKGTEVIVEINLEIYT